MLLAVEFSNLHELLRSLYDDMMPLTQDMAQVAKGVAGLGALFYIAVKVWAALSRAEPIDVFPMLRPFALGLCIMFFPTLVLGTLNAVLSPVVKGTHGILEDQVLDLNAMQQQKDLLERESLLRNPETAYLASDEEFDRKLDELGWSPSDLATMSGMYVERGLYQLRKSFRDGFRELLEILFQAAALIVDTIRTFFLIVLSILGPLAFALSVFDGFHQNLTQWLGRYISVYMWLPVSDLFSSMLARIQTLIIKHDIENLADPSFIPDTTNTVYIIFMLIGIVGYFTIPTVAGWIVQAGGMGSLQRKLSHATKSATNAAGAVSGGTFGNVIGILKR